MASRRVALAEEDGNQIFIIWDGGLRSCVSNSMPAGVRKNGASQADKQGDRIFGSELTENRIMASVV
jgi:hypothetical protein